ncbi:MAG: 30S ribosomal protein S12 methylthiotransferase RimO [Eubacteriales bacterium]
MKKIAFLSLGCAKNLVNTEQMMSLCAEAGYDVTSDPLCADVAIINTCGFIDSAKSEAIDHILDLVSLKNEGQLGKIIVAGCLSQRYRDEIFSDIPEVDGLIGTGSYTAVVDAIRLVLSHQKADIFHDIHHTDEEGDRILSTPSYSAYLKIAEGCNHSCAFCIIPKLRGKYRSRSLESLIKDATKLAQQGTKELIVIAQDTTRYGLDLKPASSLAQLLTELVKLDFHWIRLHYLYPEALTDELIDVIASQKKILPYLDIPIQHANNELLASMKRNSTKEGIIALFDKLRAKIPNLVLRTSLICGLPGESKEAFEELCDFLWDQKIQRAGVFAYSREEGTLAAEMEDQVDDHVAAHRVELLVDLQSRIMDEFYDSLLGQTMEVLCEGFDEGAGCYVGRSYADSPDIDGRVLFTASGTIPSGTFVNVLLTETSEGDLLGEIAE